MTCPFLKDHPNVITPICQFVEFDETSSSRVRIYYCKCCGQTNEIDLDALSHKHNSQTIAFFGIFLIAFVIIITVNTQYVVTPTSESHPSQHHRSPWSGTGSCSKNDGDPNLNCPPSSLLKNSVMTNFD